MSAKAPKTDFGQNRKTASWLSLQKFREMSLSGSTVALRQARARTKGKARAYPRRARSDLQRVVGNVGGKKVFFRLQRDVRHDIDPFVGGARPNSGNGSAWCRRCLSRRLSQPRGRVVLVKTRSRH